jgi:phosphoglycerate dehydrogenase-like enzyme
VVVAAVGQTATMTRPIRVLSHLGDADALRLPPELRARVEVVALPMSDPPPDDATGEVLLTLGRPSDGLVELLGRGVRWIQVIGTGVDAFPLHLVPDEVQVTNMRGASAVAISEWVLAMMLAFEKRLPQSWLDAATEVWPSDPRLGTLRGRTLGLVGLGGIGRATADRAGPFGMRVLALRRSAAGSPHPDVELVGTLADLLTEADHLVLAAPLTDATRHLLDAESFALMKPGVHLVNIARGGLVDQDALRVALDDGTVACASLDAVDPEPLPVGHWLYDHPRVRLSPHISWSRPGAIADLLEAFFGNLRRYLDGEPLGSPVDREAGY